jgi:hypothetical protein
MSLRWRHGEGIPVDKPSRHWGYVVDPGTCCKPGGRHDPSGD